MHTRLADLGLLGDSGGVVNSLTFARLLLLPVRTFFTMEGGDSEFANLRICEFYTAKFKGIFGGL